MLATPAASAAVRVSVTAALFHPAAFGTGLLVTVVAGGVWSRASAVRGLSGPVQDENRAATPYCAPCTGAGSEQERVGATVVQTCVGAPAPTWRSTV